MSELNYKNSGVDRDKADRFVGAISKMVKSTLTPQVHSHVGGYASIYKLSKSQWIAASTDGVGTKLKLAFEWDMHDFVGEDLVAMSVNDLICVGSKPLFFLDYFATGKLDSKIAERVIAGIVSGCKKAGVALVGGETAEMPGFYSDGEYDLAGFAVGSVEPENLLPKQKGKNKIAAGDVLIGIESNGFHSNGFSMVRKLIERAPSNTIDERLIRELMRPTHIYVDVLWPLIKKEWISGAAHITGSGFLNTPRMSTSVDYFISLPKLSERPKVYSWLKAQKSVSFNESCQTFNQGIGMILVVKERCVRSVLGHIKKEGYRAWVIGETQKKKSKKTSCVRVHSEEDGQCELIY